MPLLNRSASIRVIRCLLCFLVLMFLPTSVWSQRQVMKALVKPSVTSIQDENGKTLDLIVLKSGDRPTIIVVTGRNLHTVKQAQLFGQKRVDHSHVEVKILESSMTKLKLVLKVKTDVFKGKGFYLQLQDSRQNRLADVKMSRINLTVGGTKVATRTTSPKSGIKTSSRTVPGSKVRTPSSATQKRQPQTRLSTSPRQIQWSEISMKKRTGNEVKPPYLGGKRAFNAKIKPADFRQQNIQINRKPRIPFEKIENPFDPDFMIKLPDNTEISAADYYQELNQLEEAFNRDGYSLNPDKQKEREIVYAKVPSAVKSAAAGASVKADQKVPVKQIEPIRQTYLQRMASARQSLRSTQSTGVMQRVPETRTGLKVKSNPYQRMLHSSTEGGKPFYLSAFMNGWSDLYADMEKSHIKHNAEFGVWIFGNQIKILDLVGSTQTSYSGGQLVTEMTGNLWQLNNIPIPKEKRNVPTVPPEDMSALPEIPPVEQSFSLYDIDQCFETRFIVGPVPVYFRVGVSGEAGVHCTMGASPVFASNFCDFWVVADAYAQAAVQFPGKDIVIPTVTCDLTFIDSHLYMNGMIEREGEKITSEYYIDKMSMMCYGLFYLHTTVFVLTPIGLGYGYIPFVFVTQVASLPGDLEIDMLSERYSDRWPLQVKAVE